MNPSPLGFNPEPTIPDVTQRVGLDPEQDQCRTAQLGEPDKARVGQCVKVCRHLNPLGFRHVTPKEWLGDTDQISRHRHPDLGFSPASLCAASSQGVQAPIPRTFPLLDVKAVRTLSNREAEELIRKVTVDAVRQHALDEAMSANELAAVLLTGSFNEAAEVLSLSSLTAFARRHSGMPLGGATVSGQGKDEEMRSDLSAGIQRSAQANEKPSDSSVGMQPGAQVCEPPAGWYACIQPSAQMDKVCSGSPAHSQRGFQADEVQSGTTPLIGHAGKEQPEQTQGDVASLGRRGNLNLLLGYEAVGLAMVSFFGGEKPSLYNLGTSSVATMYRVANGISQTMAHGQTPMQLSKCHLDHGAPNPMQVEKERLSPYHSLEPGDRSSKMDGSHYQIANGAPWFPGDHLTWYVLLKEGTMSAYAGKQGLNLLLASSEGLKTLGWGLGVSSPSKSVSDSLSDPRANAVRGPTLPQDPDVGVKGRGDKVSVCKRYIKGWCRKGQSCGFPHVDISAGSGTSAPLSQGDKEGVRKVCPHFLKAWSLKGNCLRGETCGYAHSRCPAPVDQAGAKQDSKQQAEGVQLRCPHFAKGFCRRGDTCKFTHDSGNLDPKEPPPRPEVDRRVKHQPLAQIKKNQLREAGLLDVCFRWAQGRCDTTSCRFSHRPLGQGEIELFRELLDGDDIQPEALPAGDQATATQEQPQQNSVREGHPWDVTVPLLQPAPLILEQSIPDKCKLSAPRPSSSLSKGVKVSMPGSTILRRKLGDHSSTRVMPLSSQQTPRSVLTQPCVLASPPSQPEKRLQHQRTWCRLKVSRSRISGSLKNEFTPVKGPRFPLSSYVLNPPGTRPKPLIASSNKDVATPIKSEPGKQSVFRKAWADVSDSDSSEEEPVVCELPPLLSQVESSSGREALTGFSRTYRRLRQYAFWKLRKGHCHKRPKELNTCSKSSSESQSIASCHDSLSLPRFVDESALENNNGTGEGNCSSANVADCGPRAHRSDRGSPRIMQR